MSGPDLGALMTDNRKAIAHSKRVGCVGCHFLGAASDITAWVSERNGRPDPHGTTAICPACGFDLIVAGDATPLDAALLKKMHNQWFTTK